MFTFVLWNNKAHLTSICVLTPSVVCFILWRIQTPNRPQTQLIIRCAEKICGMGEVYLTISCHKTRTDVRTKLNFPFCAFKIMQLLMWNSNCGIENGFAVAVGRVRWNGSVVDVERGSFFSLISFSLRSKEIILIVYWRFLY